MIGSISFDLFSFDFIIVWSDFHLNLVLLRLVDYSKDLLANYSDYKKIL